MGTLKEIRESWTFQDVNDALLIVGMKLKKEKDEIKRLKNERH